MVQTAQNPEDQIQNTAVDHSRKSAHRIQLGSLELSVPEGWIREKPVSSMRTAQFRLPRAEGDLEDAEVAVFNNIGVYWSNNDGWKFFIAWADIRKYSCIHYACFIRHTHFNCKKVSRY
jgi:hypothetical protein